MAISVNSIFGNEREKSQRKGTRELLNERRLHPLNMRKKCTFINDSLKTRQRILDVSKMISENRPSFPRKRYPNTLEMMMNRMSLDKVGIESLVRSHIRPICVDYTLIM